MSNKPYRPSTLALHAGQVPDPTTGSRAVPIYQTTSFVFKSAEHAANLFALKEFGNIYTRIMNPTTDVLEQRVAAIEKGVGALAVSSGQAATTFALLNITQVGDEIVAANNLYGGTYQLLHYTMKKLGRTVRFVDSGSLQAFRNAITPKTRAIFAETIGNPKLDVPDFESLAKIAHDAGVPLIVDNTIGVGLVQPLEHGADIIVSSATKYIGGHGTTMGGVIVESGRFPWGNGKFPGMTTPSQGYHGVIFHETFGDFGYTMRCRMETMRTFGPALAPFNAWMLLQGLETLPVRMDRHCANALKVAEFLSAHPQVAWVNYPGLPGNRYYELARKVLPRGASSLLSFGIKGGARAGEKFIDAATFMSHLANIGDAKTLVIHPASTTHRQMSEEDQVKAGVLPEMIRVSVGIETVDDILWDIDQSLHAAAKG